MTWDLFWYAVQGFSIGFFLVAGFQFLQARNRMNKARGEYFNAAISMDDARSKYLQMTPKGSMSDRLAQKKTIYPKGDPRNEL